MLALEWLINVFWTFWVRIGIVVQKIIFNWAELFVCWYFIKNLNGWDSFPGIFHLADRISFLAPHGVWSLKYKSQSLLSSATSYQSVLLRSLQMTFPKPVLECLIVPKNHLEIGKIWVTSMLVTDVGDQMCWWQVWDVRESRQHNDSATNIWNQSPS